VNDWAGAWVVTVSGTETNPTPFNVVPGGSPLTASSPGDPDQHLQMLGCVSGSNKAERAMDPWTGDFILEFDAKYTGLPTATQQIQFESTTSSLRPLNVKWEANGTFKVNDLVLLNYNGGTPGFANMNGNWVTVKIVCDWDTATFDLYWSNDTTGALAYVGQKVGWKDAGYAGTPVLQMEVGAPKVAVGTSNGLELDRITLVPEPITLALLGLGGLVGLRRRRA